METYANFRDDPAWPKDRHASLWRCADLPHGYIPTQSACTSAQAAKQVAEKDAGRPLEWEERRGESGLEIYSNVLPYKDGTLFYVIWI